ncbi:hypothetical protein U9M48_021479 [Paspalum notatum var. saurae]|uniref:HMA domain-containing protein n=1 Tax=Paspalum notatum var. saurae TaxID=547442 RepID=A0AAQ3TJQ6_PASNO
MGKKKSGRTGAAGGDSNKQAEAAATGTAFLLRVPMHCRCRGCTDKIRAGVKDLTLHHHLGIQALDQSELSTKGELRVFATGDPDKLRRRLHKSTGKTVDLQQQQQQTAKDAAAENELIQALLLRGALQPPAPAAQYAHQVLPGYAAPQQAAYSPWAVDMLLHQQQQAEAAYPAAAAAAAYQYQYQYPGAAYAYAYPQGLGGGVWPGHAGAY